MDKGHENAVGMALVCIRSTDLFEHTINDVSAGTETECDFAASWTSGT